MNRKVAIEEARKRGQDLLQTLYSLPSVEGVRFVLLNDPGVRKEFDKALDEIHYAKSCQRVGRCIRLAVMLRGQWVGGIVLGSPFPNIEVRDEDLGLKKFVRGFAARGLTSPWSRRNREYWNALQTIVNHARTFIFPSFQGRGIGKEAHRLLLTDGVAIWERRYSHKVYALDTLCDHSDSGLFISNGWSLAGETRGYTADYKRSFASKRQSSAKINNAALKLGTTRWQVWTRVLRQSLRP